MRTFCVVVTYNRINLLRENIAALNAQTTLPDKIIIVNNHSTDSTAQYLDTLIDNDRYVIINLPENIGGSGGFCVGIEKALQLGCDNVWIMDDDTIPQPTALQQLTEAITLDSKIGFVCSKVVWTDGSDSIMNMPSFFHKDNTPIEAVDSKPYLKRIQSCSFVSVLIKSEVFYKVGLPYAEFFIWHDDAEFTLRTTQAGYLGLYNELSIALHKTKTNYSFRIEGAPVEAAPRFYYQARNSIFSRRPHKSNYISYLFSALNHYRIYLHKINQRPDKSHNKEFKRAVRKGFIDALTFNPKIKFPAK